MSSSLITYTYETSPYSHKIFAACALAGIRPQNVKVSAILPRPELESLGIVYRRIPIMLVGKDCYLDSQKIIDKIETMSHDPLYPRENKSAIFGLKLLGDVVYLTTLRP